MSGSTIPAEEVFRFCHELFSGEQYIDLDGRKPKPGVLKLAQPRPPPDRDHTGIEGTK